MQQSTCSRTGKKIFTERAARDELAKIIKLAITGQRPGAIHRTDTDATLESGIYRCRFCKEFHLSSNPKTGQVITR